MQHLKFPPHTISTLVRHSHTMLSALTQWYSLLMVLNGTYNILCRVTDAIRFTQFKKGFQNASP